MIFDIEIELGLLESQPEWIDVEGRVNELIDTLDYHRIQFNKNPDKFNQKRIEKTESEIKFFQNILAFWAMNYNKMKTLHDVMNHQVEASNTGGALLSLIDDLKIANKYQYEENIILSETFVKLANSKGMNTDVMDSVLKNLRMKVKEHLVWVNQKIKDIVNE